MQTYIDNVNKVPVGNVALIANTGGGGGGGAVVVVPPSDPDNTDLGE